MKSRAKLVLVHDEPVRGPSRDFIRRSRNPDLPSPVRFEPTVKGEGDLVL
jgi:hypothetical protein